MLSFKLYQFITKPTYNINCVKCSLISSRNHLLKNSIRSFNQSRQPGNNFNIKKFFIFGFAGSLVSYTSCAIWEFENYKSASEPGTSIFRRLFIDIFRRQPKAQDIYWVIAGINFIIFAMFRIRTSYSQVLMNFPLSTYSKPSSLLFSMFTHMDLFHIMMNMYALHSFSPLINYFGAPHFMAIYLSGGLLSGLGSLVYKYLRNITVPSVGASGAILTIVGMFASLNPNLMFGIPIISDFTGFTFSAKSAVLSLIAFDLCGLIFFKMSRFDHVCHLTAVMLGVFYGLTGKSYIWDSRHVWMSWYYYLRS